MKKITSLAALLFLVFAGSAHGATIYSNTSATSNTGGNTVEEGGSVTTGDASASVHTENYSDDGESETYIKTEVNGEVYEETIDNATKVEVEVRATPKETTIKKTVDGESEVKAVHVESNANVTTEASTSPLSVAGEAQFDLSVVVFEAFSSLFNRIWSFFI